VFLLLAHGGCAVDQAKEVATYRKVLDTDAIQGAYENDASQPLTLDDALRYANRNNEQLGIEGENYLQALIDRKRAVANFLPTIELAPTYADRDAPPGGSETGGGGSRNTRVDVPVTGEVNLFRGFGDVANLRASAFTIERRRALLLDVQQSLLIDVARAFFAVLRAERSAEVLRNSIAVQEERVRDMQEREAVGFARPVDVAQVEAQASSSRVELIRANNDARNGRQLLTLLTGVEIGDRPLAPGTDVPESLMPVDDAIQTALATRQDLRAALSSIEAARQDVQAALGQYWPSVSLNVSYFLSRESAPADSDWTALLSANLPLFSAGLVEADVRQAWSALRQAKYFESLTRRRVVQDVRIAYENLLGSRARLAELRTTLRAAQDALDQATANQQAGRGTTLESVVAQEQLLRAQLQLASEEFDYKIAYLNLLRSAGVLTDVLKLPATMPATRAVE
jgi:outer membrane protein